MRSDQQVSGSDLQTPCSENDQWSSKASSKNAPSARAEVGDVLERTLDSRRRLSLAGVGDPAHKRYRAKVRHDGTILLLPVVSVLARDLICDENAERSRISSEDFDA